jgi:hypothetical protein
MSVIRFPKRSTATIVPSTRRRSYAGADSRAARGPPRAVELIDRHAVRERRGYRREPVASVKRGAAVGKKQRRVFDAVRDADHERQHAVVGGEKNPAGGFDRQDPARRSDARIDNHHEIVPSGQWRTIARM